MTCGPTSAYVSITIGLTMFFCWCTQEILERRFNMAPVITTANEVIKKAASSTTTDNPKKKFIMNIRLTKSLDIKGHYRIQTRGCIYFIKAIWAMPIFITSICIFTIQPQWFIDHFILLNPDTVCYPPYQHISASIAALYLWELMANRYGKLDWGIIVHHWLTIIAAISIILGRFTPFATWYGFSIVSMAPPINIAFGIRATYSNKLPIFTRNAFTFCFWYWLTCITVCISGEVFLIINSLLPSHFNKSVSVFMVAFMCISIVGWVYDDYQLLKALRDFAKHSYEDAEILEKRNSEHIRVLGGRDLFALSMRSEIDSLRQHTLSGSPPTIQSPPPTASSLYRRSVPSELEREPLPNDYNYKNKQPKKVTFHEEKNNVNVFVPSYASKDSTGDTSAPLQIDNHYLDKFKKSNSSINARVSASTTSVRDSQKLVKMDSLTTKDLQGLAIDDENMQMRLEMALTRQPSDQTKEISENLRLTFRSEIDRQITLNKDTVTPRSPLNMSSNKSETLTPTLSNMDSKQLDEIIYGLTNQKT